MTYFILAFLFVAIAAHFGINYLDGNYTILSETIESKEKYDVKEYCFLREREVCIGKVLRIVKKRTYQSGKIKFITQQFSI